MSQKLKADISSVLVQLERVARDRSDFSESTLMEQLRSVFTEMDRFDLSAGGAPEIDKALATRVGTVLQRDDPLSSVIGNCVVLDFWYILRPGQAGASSLITAKKLRREVDDSRFIENTVLPLLFGGRLQRFGKHDYELRELLLDRYARVYHSFREEDEVPASATKIIQTDFWQKKMLRISVLKQDGLRSQLPAIATRDELREIARQSPFARTYLEKNKLFVLPNRFWLSVKAALSNLISVVLSPFNFRFVVHVFRNRLPVYLVYLILTLAFIYGAVKMPDLWRLVHDDHLREVEDKYPRITELEPPSEEQP
jgi:hypothetical protein